MKKVFLILILALAAIGIVVFILLGRYTDRVIDPYVRSLLEQTKPMGHRIEYRKIRVNLFEKFIILKDVKMFPGDSLTENDLQIVLNVKDIKLTGFGIRKMLFDKTLIVNDFVIANPEVVITLPLHPEEAIDDMSEVEKEKEKKKSSQLLKKILLNRIVMTEGSFKLMHNDVILASSADINILATDLALEKNSREEPVGFTYGDYTITLTDVNLHSESSLYDITLDKISAGKKNLSIVLNGLKITPKYDKKEFSKKLEFQTDRFDVKIGEMKVSHTGLWKLLEDKPLEITMLSIDGIDADIYRDKNVTFNFNRFPPFYNESFLKIPLPILIDTLNITNSKLNYQELSEGRPEAGSIILESFNAQAYNLTNLVEEDTAINVMHLFIQAMVMGEGPLNADLILPLEGDLHKFEFNGSVGAMNLAPLNAMLEPAINMKFKGGRLNRMTLHFTADDNTSRGWMEFLYNDIDVELLKKDPDKQWGFVSLLANTVALSNNPHEGKAPKIVEIGYERDKNKGIINYLWKTIQSGMVRTIIPTGKYTINKKNSEKEKAKAEKEGEREKKKKK